MNIHTEIDEASSAEWDEFLAASPKGHLLQSSYWGTLKSAFGWNRRLVTVRDGGAVIAGAQVLFRPLPLIGRLKKTIAYVPKGPIVDYSDDSILKALLCEVEGLARRHGAVLLKIEPDELQSTRLDRKLEAAGFRPSLHTIQPLGTIVLDLSQGLDAVLAQMSSKTRYNIRLAERKGVRVRTGSEEDVEKFYALSMTTSQRDQFSVHALSYYLLAYRLFYERDMVRLFLADYEGTLIAGLMAFAIGHKAWYLYGASSNDERQRMPNHALQWAAMNWAHEKGCLSYDLWGIPEDAPEWEAEQSPRLQELVRTPPPGTLWGVYRFKRGFGGQSIRYAGAYDRVFSSTLYRLYEKFARHRQGAAV